MKPRFRTWTPYILPNVLTSLNMMAGFYALVRVLNRDFDDAAWAVLIAVILDGMDGLAARLTKGFSGFGLEFDSMADLISFGITPAVFMYLWVLKPYGRIGWVAAFLFMACGVLRLARFNVQSHDLQKYRFLGIPIPAAATQVVTTYLITDYLEIGRNTSSIAVIVTAYLTAFLMISNIPYRSTKTIIVRRRHSFYIPVLFILIAAIVWIYPFIILWLLSTVYLASGPAESFFGKTLLLKRKVQEGHDHPQQALKSKTGKETNG